MGRYLNVILEYDGENSIRNDFVCEIDDFEYSFLRKWEDFYSSDLNKYSSKKHSLKTLRASENCGCDSWGINNIVTKIESMKGELALDTQLEKQDKENLQHVVGDLQRLYDVAMKNCTQRNLDPEKCYLALWID